MTRIAWDAHGAHMYEAGVDRGVLYVGDQPGVAWNGLTSVDEKPIGGAAVPYYIDGVKYLNVPSSEEFAASISAFTYPDEFGVCDGTVQVRRGLFTMNQRRQSFGFSYRTKMGNELVGTDLGYKIHLIYGALAAPSQRTNSTFKDASDPTDFTWDVTTVPPIVSGFRTSAHIVLDSRLTPADALSAIEDILYGTDTDAARIPGLAELDLLVGYYINLIELIDNFDAGTIDTDIWTLQQTGSLISEADGVLTILSASSYPSATATGAPFDISTGILAARVYNGAGATASSQVQLGAVDSSGNGIFVLSNVSTSTWTFLAKVSATVTSLGIVAGTGIGPNWTNGDFLGIGNLGSDNVVHIYKSSDGVTWTEIGSATVGGTFDKTAAELKVAVGFFSGTSTYSASIDDAAIFSVP